MTSESLFTNKVGKADEGCRGKKTTLKIARYSGKSRDDRFQGELTELEEGIAQGKAKFNTDKSKCAWWQEV